MISNVCLWMAAAVAGEPSIDAWVARAADRDGVALTAVVSDDRFLRRVTLDLIGRIPTTSELQAFRERPDRPALVDRLLASVEHPRFWSRLWTNTLIGYGVTQQADRESLRLWLEQAFQRRVGFDRVVSELISAEGIAAFDGPANFMLRHTEDPVVPIGRLFLGIQLDCARCHDHPSDRWTQEDFGNMQRFFSLVQRRQPSPGSYEVLDRQPAGDSPRPRFLTGATPRTGRWRQELALYVTSCKPFGRAVVNRLWHHFLGRGIVHPPDTVGSHPDHPDRPLIDELASRLESSGFDLQAMIREICLSQAYQREVTREAAHADWTLLPTVKLLTPDQLYDSLLIALEQPDRPGRREQFSQFAAGAALSETIADTWALDEPVQVLLTRLNLELPDRPVSVPTMFRRALSRDPSERERERCENLPERDVLFALVHGSEFSFWH